MTARTNHFGWLLAALVVAGPWAAISARLVELAARLQAREALIIRNEKRIRELEEKESSLLALLAMNRSAIAELLAALQKLRRDPPPPFVTRPDDVLAAVRGALLLSSAVPQVDARVARLLGSISRLRRVREGLKREQEEKRRNIEQLRRTRKQIDELLTSKRDLMRRIDARLEEEQKRLKRLTDKARTLNEVMAALHREERRRREMEKTGGGGPPGEGEGGRSQEGGRENVCGKGRGAAQAGRCSETVQTLYQSERRQSGAGAAVPVLWTTFNIGSRQGVPYIAGGTEEDDGGDGTVRACGRTGGRDGKPTGPRHRHGQPAGNPPTHSVYGTEKERTAH